MAARPSPYPAVSVENDEFSVKRLSRAAAPSLGRGLTHFLNGRFVVPLPRV